MSGFVCYEKLSKRKKREFDRLGRKGWGDISPVTRRPERSGAYARSGNKALIRSGRDEADKGLFLCARGPICRCNSSLFVR